MEKLDEKKLHKELEMPKEELFIEDIVDGLNEIGITESESVDKIWNKCDVVIDSNKDVLRKRYQLSYEEAWIISTYTHGNGNPEESPYIRINEKLRGNVYEDQIRNPKSYLRVLLRALRKLSRTKPQTLYRSIRNDTQIYVEGEVITWKGFTSTSLSVKVTKNFITNPETKKVSGTLFEIRDMWGYDIADFSCHPVEKGFLKNT